MIAGEYAYVAGIPDYEIIWHNHPHMKGVSFPSVEDMILTTQTAKNVQVSIVITHDGIFIQKLAIPVGKSLKRIERFVALAIELYQKTKKIKLKVSTDEMYVALNKFLRAMLKVDMKKLNIGSLRDYNNRIKFYNLVFLPFTKKYFGIKTDFLTWDDLLEFKIYPYEPKIHKRATFHSEKLKPFLSKRNQ